MSRPLLRMTLCLVTTLGCLTETEESRFEPDEHVADSVEGELRTNSDANRLVVYSNNIENMIFDWKDLVHTMAEDELRPDIFLVQQITSRSELRQLHDFMKRTMGVDYDGVVAQDHPADQRFSGEVQPRPTVTTGIIFRSSRFELVAKDSWMPFGRGFANQPKTCDERSNHSGYETLRVKLYDKVARKHVVLVSLRHWTWHPCSAKNLREIVEGHEGGPNDHAGFGAQSDLHIVAGDFNDRIFDGEGNFDCWYRQAVRGLGPGDCAGGSDLGFTDPLFEACNGEKSCMRRSAGVDHILVRRPDGRAVRTDHNDSISWEQAHRASVQATGGDGPSNSRATDGYVDQADRYSGHEARTAYIYYE